MFLVALGGAQKSVGAAAKKDWKVFVAGAVCAVTVVSLLLGGFHAFLENVQQQESAAYISAPKWSSDKPRAHRDTLDEHGTAAYDAIEGALRNHLPAAALPLDTTFSEGEDAFFSVLLDNPDILWATPTYVHIPFGDRAAFIFFQYVLNPVEAKVYHASLVANVNATVQKSKVKASTKNRDYGAEELVRELVNEEAFYLEYEKNDLDQTTCAFAAGGGKTVCSGYAKTFKLLCDAADIECYCVDGMLYGSENSRHLWNMLYADDGRVIFADPTNSDSGTSADTAGIWITDRGGLFEDSHVPGELSARMKIVEDGKAQTDSQHEVPATPAEKLDKLFEFIRNIDENRETYVMIASIRDRKSGSFWNSDLYAAAKDRVNG